MRWPTHRMQTIVIRHTDRRPVTGAKVQPVDIAAVTESIEVQGARLHVLHPEQLPTSLSAAAEYARRTKASESPWRGRTRVLDRR